MTPAHNPDFKGEKMKKKDPSPKTAQGRKAPKKIGGIYWGAFDKETGELAELYSLMDYPHGLPLLNDQLFSVVKLEIREVPPPKSPKGRGK